MSSIIYTKIENKFHVIWEYPFAPWDDKYSVDIIAAEYSIDDRHKQVVGHVIYKRKGFPCCSKIKYYYQ